MKVDRKRPSRDVLLSEKEKEKELVPPGPGLLHSTKKVDGNSFPDITPPLARGHRTGTGKGSHSGSYELMPNQLPTREIEQQICSMKSKKN